MGFIDIKKAYLYAKLCKPTYIQLPPGEEQDGMCGRLNVSSYGARDAASNWESEYTNTMENAGFVRGLASTCIFRRKEKDIRVVVHGDDFTVLARTDDVQWVANQLAEKYTIKLRGVLGPNTELNEITVLNRIIRWTRQGLEYEADPRHAEIIVNELGLGMSKGISTPGTRQGRVESGEPLDHQDPKLYRSLVARAN